MHVLISSCNSTLPFLIMMTSSNGNIFRVTGPFLRGIHQSPANSPHKGQRRGALIFSLICAWLNAWVNNCEASDLRRHRAHYDVIVMNTIFETNTKQNRFRSPLYNQVQKILVRKITVGGIGPGNGLSPTRCQRISWTSDGIFSIKNWTWGIKKLQRS